MKAPLRTLILAATLGLAACAPHGGGFVVTAGPAVNAWGAGPGFHAPRHVAHGPRWPHHRPGWHDPGWHHRHGWRDTHAWHRSPGGWGRRW